MRFTAFTILSLMLLGALHTTTGQEDRLTAAGAFEQAYRLLLAADAARDRGDLFGAVNLYGDAAEAYGRLSRQYPEWQPGVVRFRTAYSKNQLESLLAKVGVPDAVDTTPHVSPADAGPGFSTDDAPLEMPLFRAESEVEEDPLDVRDMVTAARRLTTLGETSQARSFLLEALRADPDSVEIRLLLGVVQCQAGAYEDALYLLERLVEDAPHNPDGHLLLATAMFGLGLIEDAEAALARTLELAPDSSEAHYNLAQLLLVRVPPDPGAARHHYLAALDLDAESDPGFEQRLDKSASDPAPTPGAPDMELDTLPGPGR